MTLTTKKLNEIYENPEQCSYSEIQEMAALLANREAQSVADAQFKPVSDLYAIRQEGSASYYVTDAAEALRIAARHKGARIDEYVALKRLQEAYTAPPAPAVPILITEDEQEEAVSDGYADSFRGGWNACRAAMLAQPVIPVEPTAAMQAAGAAAIRFDTTPINKLFTANAVYRAMLAAAPEGGNG
jgi:hypothetical protein